MNGKQGLQQYKLAFIAIGSNLGDSRELVRKAMVEMQVLSERPLLKSSSWQTAPVDCPPGSPMFVNAAVGFLPKLGETPESLLGKLQAMEKKFNRLPKKVLNEPRPLDLDIIAFAGQTRSTLQLIVPHPRAHQRRFVLEPLNEIAPDLILPGQSRTVAELLEELPADETMKKLE